MRKILALSLIFTLLIAVFVGCSGGSPVGDRYANAVGGAGDMNESVQKGELSPDKIEQADRKLIKTVSISAQTKEYDHFLSAVRAQVEATGGYIESYTEDASAYRDYRSATLVLRIPAKDTDATTDLIGQLGTVTRKEERISDVTLQYVDTEARLKALRTEEASLLALLAEAKNVGDIITVRDRLSEVQYQIESYEATLRAYDNKISYSTITLYVSEVERETAPEKDSVWAEIGGNLADAFYNIGKFFRGFFVFSISALPYLAVIALFVGVILFFSVFLPLRRRRKKKQKENQ